MVEAVFDVFVVALDLKFLDFNLMWVDAKDVVELLSRAQQALSVGQHRSESSTTVNPVEQE